MYSSCSPAKGLSSALDFFKHDDTQLTAVSLSCACGPAQVSEKILLLDAEAKELRLAAAAADDRAEVLAREKVQVMGLAEELRADVAAKMALLDEFEARFARQYRWARSYAEM